MNSQASDRDKENLIPSIEFRPYVSLTHQPFTTEAPRIEFFDPSNQRWPDNAAEILPAYSFEETFAVNQASIFFRTRLTHSGVRGRGRYECTPYFVMDR